MTWGYKKSKSANVSVTCISSKYSSSSIKVILTLLKPPTISRSAALTFTGSAPASSRNALGSPPSFQAATIGRSGPRRPSLSSRSSCRFKNLPTSSLWPTNWKAASVLNATGSRWPPLQDPIFPCSSASPNYAPRPGGVGNAHALMNSGNTILPSTSGGQPKKSRPCS